MAEKLLLAASSPASNVGHQCCPIPIGSNTGGNDAKPIKKEHSSADLHTLAQINDVSFSYTFQH